MENETIISVKNIGKKYDITHQRGGYVALRDVIANVIKSPFRFLKQKTKEVAGIAKKEEFWALRNVNFEVKKGEVIGIIGRNGAGKSTLLKILSQITPPTEGEIKIKGRVGSLLEVGTGFHPELSGRENIFLNGAILGMTKSEIAKKFDDIVAFAGIDKFLDTPVKRYSSGMYVRLAFSVAAHMDPDILIIDEVLAVGDAEFQKKCLGRMDEITKKEGRTILFVSHNMGAIQQLCNKSILLSNGKVIKIGNTSEIISEYIGDQQKATSASVNYAEDKNKTVKIRNITILDKENNATSNIKIFDPFSVKITYDINQPVIGIQTALFCTNSDDNIIFISTESDGDSTALGEKKPGTYTSTFKILSNNVSINKGTYFLRVVIGQPFVLGIDQIANIPITITDTDSKYANLDRGNRKGAILLSNTWETKLK